MGNGFENLVERAVGELKDSVQDIINEDSLYEDKFYLLRWLRADNMNVKKAEKSMRSAAKWRKDNDILDLANRNFPDGWLDSVPFYVDGVTPDGVLVGSIQAGLVDFRGILEDIGRQRLVRLLMQVFAQAESAVIKLNRKKCENQPLTENSVEGFTMMVDMDQFQARQLRTLEGIQAVIEVFKNLAKYFPILCSRMIFVNGNKVSNVIFKIMRPLLEGPTLRFETYGPEKSEWQEKIASIMPAKFIREPYGGTRPTEDNSKRIKLLDESFLRIYA